MNAVVEMKEEEVLEVYDSPQKILSWSTSPSGATLGKQDALPFFDAEVQDEYEVWSSSCGKAQPSLRILIYVVLSTTAGLVFVSKNFYSSSSTSHAVSYLFWRGIAPWFITITLILAIVVISSKRKGLRTDKKQVNFTQNTSFPDI